ncbi:Methylmalonyl-CoA decarboxylase [Poriferisphaera corsica]|uniref:Methylmalonyl-CoA decarboxylase n=1 Tax=Poriferisphaera corsica TaxID=2528020 RepID=A0A517YXS9_9BACT|nr:methylmalonyl-CoA decarboxylase [Poriferisphaera corsica]QDU35028.1 Methylmalonyl-CoA decarboxylase [Poriferisphaera corsica]
MSLIEIKTENHIATLTLNDPTKRNCLSASLIEQLLHAFDACEKQNIRVIILTANTHASQSNDSPTTTQKTEGNTGEGGGGGVFSAGHNIDEIPIDKQDPVTWNVPYVTLLRKVRHTLTPVIASINGSVWGGACDLAVSCDMIVATTNTSFAITPAKLGLPYNTVGVSHFLGSLPTHVVKEMFMTALPLSADRAHNFGLVNRLVSPENLQSETLTLAARVASMAPLCLRVLKAELVKLSDAMNISADDFEHIQMLRRQAFRSQDFQEGIRAFHEKRPPNFKGF